MASLEGLKAESFIAFYTHARSCRDLLGHADIHLTCSKEVASDTSNYRAADVADACCAAGEILAHPAAAMSPRAREAYELMQKRGRSWS